MTNHAVSQLVTCLKNGQMARKEKVVTPSSKLKLSILDILKKDGFIQDYVVENNGSFDVIEITLSYTGLQPVIKDIEVISKPGRRVYSKVENIPVVYNGLGVVILSTPKGVITDYDAKHLNVGGELLLKIF
ncbi:MAG: 30S ribosomal protein S8 [Rickettsiales bacterium]|nr:30S ribosomal protein S8 [Rickettsiales bacterium]